MTLIQNWLRADLTGDGLGDAFMTGLILLVVVFATLCALSFIIWLFGRSAVSSAKTVAQPAVVKAPPVPAKAPSAAQVTPAQDDGEIAAVIAAAVAMMAPAGVTYRVKKITPAGMGQRPVWTTAAIHQNTAPF